MSEVTSFSFERPFKLWAHTVSHSQLLLRSTKGEGRTTRVDFLFLNVSAVLVRKKYERLSVRLAHDDEVAQIEYLTGVPLGPHARYFVIEGSPVSFVVAEAVAAHEDEGEYFDPCHFDVIPAPGLARLIGTDGNP